jgi:glycosyltransferase involved in cell wall biosynthesis
VEDTAAARGGLGLPEEGLLFGLFGQITPHKGTLSFVEAARRSLAVHGSLRFVIAGPGPEPFRRRVREAIEATGRKDRFHLLDPVRGSERLMAAADVVCLTTATPDPLPRAVLEAMAAGRPVAAFDSGGTSEMVLHEETGLLVPSGDVEGLAGAFVRLAEDGEERTAMGRAGARRARADFSLAGHLNAMEELFRSVVQ